MLSYDVWGDVSVIALEDEDEGNDEMDTWLDAID